jgi:hypothetical protein
VVQQEVQQQMPWTVVRTMTTNWQEQRPTLEEDGEVLRFYPSHHLCPRT